MAGQLRRQLETFGWVAESAEDGSVYYRRPEPKTNPPPTLADRLRIQLERQGWTASTATRSLHDVWGSSASDVFAVGG